MTKASFDETFTKITTGNDLWRKHNKKYPTYAITNKLIQLHDNKKYIDSLRNSIGLSNLKPFCTKNLSPSILSDIPEPDIPNNYSYTDIQYGKLETFNIFQDSGNNADGKTLECILSNTQSKTQTHKSEVIFAQYTSVTLERYTRPMQSSSSGNNRGIFSCLVSAANDCDNRIKLVLNERIAIIFEIKCGAQTKPLLELPADKARYLYGAAGIVRAESKQLRGGHEPLYLMKPCIIIRRNAVDKGMEKGIRFGDDIQSHSKITIRFYKKQNDPRPAYDTLTMQWKYKGEIDKYKHDTKSYNIPPFPPMISMSPIIPINNNTFNKNNNYQSPHVDTRYNYNVHSPQIQNNNNNNMIFPSLPTTFNNNNIQYPSAMFPFSLNAASVSTTYNNNSLSTDNSSIAPTPYRNMSPPINPIAIHIDYTHFPQSNDTVQSCPDPQNVCICWRCGAENFGWMETMQQLMKNQMQELENQNKKLENQNKNLENQIKKLESQRKANIGYTEPPKKKTKIEKTKD